MPVQVLTAEPLLGLERYLVQGSDFFIRTLKNRNFFLSQENLEKNVVPVFKGEKTQIPASAVPAIRIVPDAEEDKWLATRVVDEKYTFFIDCMIRTAVADMIDEYVMTLALAVKDWLLEFKNLQGKVQDTRNRYYDSWVDRVQFGWSKGQVWRIARLTYWQKIQHAYMVPDGKTSDPCA